jgi:hypothetical protein
MEWLALIVIFAVVALGFVFFLQLCGKLGELTFTIFFAPGLQRQQQEAEAHIKLMAQMELQYQLLEAQLAQAESKTV